MEGHAAGVGNISPANIDEAACRHWAAIRKASAATIRYELSMITTATNWAERQGLIEKAVQVWLPPPPPRRDRHISRQQFASFMEHVLAPHARLYAILGISTAARPGAILELTWQQIDFDRRLISLNPEDRPQTTKRRATVPMTEQAEYALHEAWDMRSTIWVVEYAGKRVASIKRAFQAASKRAGIHVTPYTLRHSAAVWMAEAGVPMEEIAAYLGHADTRTTFQHYAKYSPDYLRKAAKALSW